MFRIIKIDGTELGITDAVNYIKIGVNGCFVSATIEDAIGIAFNGVVYNLAGYVEIDDADTVVVSRVDTGTVIGELASYTELAAAIREGVNEV